MSNGLDIKSRDDFIKLYKKDDSIAMGVLFQNVQEMKEKCACRLQLCKEEQKRDRLKNASIQGGGGIVGGAITIWIYLKLSVSQLFNN